MAELDDAEPDLFVSIARSFSDDTLDRIVRNAQLQGSASELETAALVEMARRRIGCEAGLSLDPKRAPAIQD